MKETVFTKQNKKKWENFEKLLASNQSDPRKISKLFIEISDDLSYAKTFYKNPTHSHKPKKFKELHPALLSPVRTAHFSSISLGYSLLFTV